MAIATVAAALEYARKELRGESDYAARDAVVLLAHTLGVPVSYVHLYPEGKVTPEQERVFVPSLVGGRPGSRYLTYVDIKNSWDWSFASTGAS